jgi:Gas vesicle protein
MMKRATKQPQRTVSDQVLEPPEATVLDLLDHLLNKGVMANADVTLGVAGIDLIYLRLSALLCAADRIFPVDVHTPGAREKRSRAKRPRAFKRIA